MELKPQYRVVRFSPTPEINEPINVALLVIQERARLLTDKEFQKLHCVAPQYDLNILKFWLDELQEELRTVEPENASVFIASRSAQIKVGEPHFLTGNLQKDWERRLVQTYLKRQNARVHLAVEPPTEYFDTLLEHTLDALPIRHRDFLKRAKPESFLSARSLRLLPTPDVKFSRVLNGTKKIVLMDGLNLGVSNATQIQNRAAQIGLAFFTLGNVRKEIEDVEGRKIVRASFVLNRTSHADAKLDYYVTQMSRDSDFVVEPEADKNLARLEKEIGSASEPN